MYLPNSIRIFEVRWLYLQRDSKTSTLLLETDTPTPNDSYFLHHLPIVSHKIDNRNFWKKKNPPKNTVDSESVEYFRNLFFFWDNDPMNI